ncbi:MAG: tRNA pseudouridine(38-40) synthase TruA [Salinirussus sp.]
MTVSARRAYRLAYDGAAYRGFQRQPDVLTVSDAILDALRDLDIADSGVPPGYAAAGRTDAGVSAVAQTVSLTAPDWLDPAAFNSELPADIRAWAHAPVGPDFHATHAATAREYTYYLFAPEADESRAQTALESLSGRHDFHNLTPDERGTVRTLSGRLEKDDQVLQITVRAGGFPRQLVRRLVTVIERIATGTADSDFVADVLGTEARTGPEGIPPAPPEPLVLTGVDYPNVTFDVHPEAAASAQAEFGRRRAQHTARSRVAGRILTEIDNDEASSTTAGDEQP